MSITVKIKTRIIFLWIILVDLIHIKLCLWKIDRCTKRVQRILQDIKNLEKPSSLRMDEVLLMCEDRLNSLELIRFELVSLLKIPLSYEDFLDDYLHDKKFQIELQEFYSDYRSKLDELEKNLKIKE